MPETLLPIPVVAERLGGISEKTVRNLIHRGELPGTRVGARLFVTDVDLDDFIAAAKTAVV